MLQRLGNHLVTNNWTSPLVVSFSVLPGASFQKGDGSFGYMRVGTSTEPDLRCMVLDNILGLVRRTGFMIPNNGLDVLRLAECGSRDIFMLISLCHAMTRSGLRHSLSW